MAVCIRCFVELPLITVGPYCIDCARIEAQMADPKVGATSRRVNAVMLTTENSPLLNVVKRLEIVTAECAVGTEVLEDLFASVRDISENRSRAVQDKMRDARRTALYELKVEADLAGANAVVGVSLSYLEISHGKGLVMLIAAGTAVIIEP